MLAAIQALEEVLYERPDSEQDLMRTDLVFYAFLRLVRTNMRFACQVMQETPESASV